MTFCFQLFKINVGVFFAFETQKRFTKMFGGFFLFVCFLSFQQHVQLLFSIDMFWRSVIQIGSYLPESVESTSPSLSWLCVQLLPSQTKKDFTVEDALGSLGLACCVYIWHNNARQLKTSFQSGIITSTYSLPQINRLIKPFLLKLQSLT